MVRDHLVLAGVGALLGLFLLMPLLALALRTSYANFVTGITHPMVWPALRLSLFTTSVSLACTVVFGTPLSWLLAMTRTRLTRAIETFLQLPVVIPPAVAGIALLLAFGRRGVFSGWLYPRGTSLAFTTWAIIMAELFVSAPFFIQAATSAFRRVDPELITVARSFGAGPLRVFARIGLPLARPGLVAGSAMSWARALGEFGATLMFAGNFSGQTQTLPLAIYTALEVDLRIAQALALVLVVIACCVLLIARSGLGRSLDAWRRDDEP